MVPRPWNPARRRKCRAPSLEGVHPNDWWYLCLHPRSQESRPEEEIDWPTTAQGLKRVYKEDTASDVFNKKLALTRKLHDLKIDIACIQETHLNQNNRFSIRGYQCFRLDREARHKGGVLTLIKNNIAAAEIKIDTAQEAEIIGCKLMVQQTPSTTTTVHQTRT